MNEEKEHAVQSKPHGRPGGYELKKQVAEALRALLESMSISELADAFECSQDRARVMARVPKDLSMPEVVELKDRRGEKSVANPIEGEDTKEMVVSFIHTAVIPPDDGGLGVGKTRKEIGDFLYKIFDGSPIPRAELKLFGVSIETAIDYYYKHPEYQKSEFTLPWPVKVSLKVVMLISNLLRMDCNKVAKDLDGPIAERKSGHLPVAFEKLEAGALLGAIDQGITPRFDLSELPAEKAAKIQPLLEALSEYEKENPKIFRGHPNPWGTDIISTKLFLNAQNKITEILAGLAELDLYGSKVVKFSVKELPDRFSWVIARDSYYDAVGNPADEIETLAPAGLNCVHGFVIRSFPTTGESPTIRFHQSYSGFNYSELRKEVARKCGDWGMEELRGTNGPYYVDGESLFIWDKDYSVKFTKVTRRVEGSDGPDQFVQWWHDDDA